MLLKQPQSSIAIMLPEWPWNRLWCKSLKQTQRLITMKITQAMLKFDCDANRWKDLKDWSPWRLQEWLVDSIRTTIAWTTLKFDCNDVHEQDLKDQPWWQSLRANTIMILSSDNNAYHNKQLIMMMLATTSRCEPQWCSQNGQVCPQQYFVPMAANPASHDHDGLPTVNIT